MAIDALKLHYSIISALISISTCLLAAFVLAKGRDRKLNRIYACWALCVGLWSFCLLINIRANTKESAIIWCRLLHVWAIILPAVYVHFVLGFLKKIESRRFLIKALYFCAFILVILDFTPWFLTATYREKFNFYVTKPLPLYLAHFVMFLGCINYVYYELFRGIFTTTGVHRKQVIFFLVATLSAYSGGITNYLINYDLFIFPIYPFANYGVLIYVLIVGMLIIRYKFMDIEVIIKKTLVFAGVSSFVVACFSVPLFLLPSLFSASDGLQVWFLIIAGMAVAALVGPLNNFLINVTDKYLFQKKYDYRRLLKEASREMAAIKSLKKLARTVVAFVTKRGRIKNAATFVYAIDSGLYLLEASRPFIKDSNCHTLSEDDALIRELKKLEGPLEIEELKSRIELVKNSSYVEDLVACKETMEKFHASAVIPSFYYLEKDRRQSGPVLRSVLLLGQKKSDELYSSEDLDVFFTLAQESATSIENARLYDADIQKEREVAELRLQLAQKERQETLGNMSGSIAHEIKGPIQLVQFALERTKKELRKVSELVMQDSLNDDEKKMKLSEMDANFEKYLGQVQHANDRQLTTARTIETFAKKKEMNLDGLNGESEAKESEKNRIDLFMFIKLVVELAKILYQTRDDYSIEIDTSDLSSKLPHVAMNQNQLEQVLINLILNAYDALKNSSEKKVTFHTYIDTSDDNFIHLEVGDTGSGIPEKLKEKVWEPLVTTKEEGRGTGFGLDVCKKIMEELHNGKIWFNSTIGVGTTFHLRMPIWKDV